MDAVRAFLPGTATVWGVLATPSISRPAALTLERMRLEFIELQ
ncbi:hypothetical protein [Deinococcus altitudinis]